MTEIITIYDNIPNDTRYKKDWGYSCIINHPKKKILYDTGEHAEILEANLNAASIPIASIDILVISHLHSDHMGGATWVVKQNPNITVYIPDTFSKNFERQLRQYCKNIIRVNKNMTLDHEENFHIIATRNFWIKEISLIVEVTEGPLVLSGCSHSGINKIIKTARKYIKKDIWALFGGLHLLNTPDKKVVKIAKELKEMNLRKIAPCHCTGDKALALLKENFENDFLFNGVGKHFDFK